MNVAQKKSKRDVEGSADRDVTCLQKMQQPNFPDIIISSNDNRAGKWGERVPRIFAV